MRRKKGVVEVLESGAALEKFKQMVAAQGGDVAQIDNPELLPTAAAMRPLFAPQDGYIAAIDTGVIGWAAVDLGGGRKTKADEIDHSVGFHLMTKVGGKYVKGEELGTVFGRNEADVESAETTLHTAITWSDTAPNYKKITQTVE